MSAKNPKYVSFQTFTRCRGFTHPLKKATVGFKHTSYRMLAIQQVGNVLRADNAFLDGYTGEGSKHAVLRSQERTYGRTDKRSTWTVLR